MLVASQSRRHRAWWLRDRGFERGLQPKEALVKGAGIALVERDRTTAPGTEAH